MRDKGESKDSHRERCALQRRQFSAYSSRKQLFTSLTLEFRGKSLAPLQDGLSSQTALKISQVYPPCTCRASGLAGLSPAERRGASLEGNRAGGVPAPANTLPMSFLDVKQRMGEA